MSPKSQKHSLTQRALHGGQFVYKIVNSQLRLVYKVRAHWDTGGFIVADVGSPLTHFYHRSKNIELV